MKLPLRIIVEIAMKIRTNVYIAREDDVGPARILCMERITMFLFVLAVKRLICQRQ